MTISIFGDFQMIVLLDNEGPTSTSIVRQKSIKPISFIDHQLNLLLKVLKPYSPQERCAFMAAVAHWLGSRSETSDAELVRALRELRREHRAAG